MTIRGNGRNRADSAMVSQQSRIESITPNSRTLSSEDAGAASSLDLLLSNAADELGLHHHRSLDAASAEELEHSVLSKVDHGGLAGVLLGLLLSLLRENAPQLVQVHGGAVVEVTLQVEVSHTDLTEVTGVARRVTRFPAALTTYRKGCAYGADHRPYRDPRGGNDAYLCS